MILFGTLAVAAIGILVLFLLNESSKADDERKSNSESIQVISALVCERGERIEEGKSPVVKDELNVKGFVTISLECQRFVDLLDEDLEYTGGQVRIKTNP
jgi:hypothetical protein